MIVKGIELNFDNIHDWSDQELRGFDAELRKKIRQKPYNVLYLLTLDDLISIELRYRKQLSQLNKKKEDKIRGSIEYYERNKGSWRL